MSKELFLKEKQSNQPTEKSKEQQFIKNIEYAKSRF